MSLGNPSIKYLVLCCITAAALVVYYLRRAGQAFPLSGSGVQTEAYVQLPDMFPSLVRTRGGGSVRGAAGDTAGEAGAGPPRGVVEVENASDRIVMVDVGQVSGGTKRGGGASYQ